MMNHTTHCRIGIMRLAAAGACVLAAAGLPGAEIDEVMAVYSSVSPAYSRTVLPDGKQRPEPYAFGEGGDLGGVISDDTIDRLSFIDIARLIAPALAKGAYLPCDPKEPGQAKLLIMVYWGTTVGTDGAASSSEYQIAQSLTPPPRAAMSPVPTGVGDCGMVSDPSTSGRGAEGQVLAAIQSADDSAMQQSLLLTQMANRQRDKQEMANASVLGFLNEMKRVEHYTSPAFARQRQDIVDEVAESRYYVVLMAYDFQLLRQNRQRQLLWQTRFSIPQRRNDFSRQLAAMAQSAARYFGQDSQGLVRQSVREGRVDLGELKILGSDPEKKLTTK